MSPILMCSTYIHIEVQVAGTAESQSRTGLNLLATSYFQVTSLFNSVVVQLSADALKLNGLFFQSQFSKIWPKVLCQRSTKAAMSRFSPQQALLPWYFTRAIAGAYRVTSHVNRAVHSGGKA